MIINMKDLKQKAIELAYGEYFKICNPDENGWCLFDKFGKTNICFHQIDVTIDGFLWRPKSLQGIENNNGWISVNDIPKDFINNHNEVYLSLNKITFIGYFYKAISGINYNVCNLEAQPNEIIGLHIGNIAMLDGWQPIIKPKPPIY